MTRLYYLGWSRKIAVIKNNDEGYDLYDSHPMYYFLLMLPVLGNIISLGLWLFAIFNTVEIRDKEEKKIIFKGE